MRVEEVLNYIRKIYEAIEPHEIYYAMKRMRLKRILDSTVDFVRWCVAIQEAGFPITTQLLAVLANISRTGALHRLHSLGDKKVLLLLHREGKDPLGSYQWILNPIFKQYLPDFSSRVASLYDELVLNKHEEDKT